MNDNLLFQNFRINGSMREETLDGRETLVLPCIMIKEGIWNGSEGPTLYTNEQLTLSVPLWNNVPVIKLHPKDADSAGEPIVINKQEVGRCLHTVFENGKLKTELWIDKEKLQSKAPDLFDKIMNGKMVEVSTGLTANKTPSGIWNGEAYEQEALNIRPDHLALLDGQVGACSIADGAGTPRWNQRNKDLENENNELKQKLEKVRLMNKAEKIEVLIANADNGWGEDDKEFLNSLTVPQIDKCAKITEIEVEKIVEKVIEKPIENEAKTLDEYVENAPENFKKVLTVSVDNYKNAKATTIAEILKLENNLFTKDELVGKELNELSKIATLAVKPAPIKEDKPIENEKKPTPDYSAQAPIVNETKNTNKPKPLGFVEK